jgi:hypothetical protein
MQDFGSERAPVRILRLTGGGAKRSLCPHFGATALAAAMPKLMGRLEIRARPLLRRGVISYRLYRAPYCGA